MLKRIILTERKVLLQTNFSVAYFQQKSKDENIICGKIF